MRKHVFWTIAVTAVSVLLTFGLAGCGSSDTADSEATDQTSDVDAAAAWYSEILNDDSVTAEYPYYRLLDIDQDGSEELFLSSTEMPFIGAEDKAKLMAYVDGEAVTVKDIGGGGGESFSYDAADKSLFYYSRLSGDDPETGNNPDDTYYLDGKKVTEEEADILWDQYDDQAEAITYSTDGMGAPYVDDADDGEDDDNDND